MASSDMKSLDSIDDDIEDGIDDGFDDHFDDGFDDGFDDPDDGVDVEAAALSPGKLPAMKRPPMQRRSSSKASFTPGIPVGAAMASSDLKSSDNTDGVKQPPMKRPPLQRKSSFNSLKAFFGEAASVGEALRPRWTATAPGAGATSSIFSLRQFVRSLRWTAAVGGLLVLLPAWTRAGAASYGGSRLVAVCPRVAVCSEGIAEVALLAAARATGLPLLVALAVAFATKARAAAGLWNRGSLSLVIAADGLHACHAEAGRQCAYLATAHGACHFLRWARRGEVAARAAGNAGKSGIAAGLAVVAIAALMSQRSRAALPYEVRRGGHVLLGLAAAFATVAHTTLCACVAGGSLALYGVDAIYSSFALAARVDDAVFESLGNGVSVRFARPAGWPSPKGGFVYALAPWVSRTEWHAFSAYEDGDDILIFALNSGDWTARLRAAVRGRPSTRPLWVSGPFASPFADAAADCDNLLIVATGIGITAAVGTLQRLGETRAISIAWVVRDPSLVTFYLHQGLLDNANVALVFYTGVAPLTHLRADLDASERRHIRLIDGRPPDLARVVADVVRVVETRHSALDADAAAAGGGGEGREADGRPVSPAFLHANLRATYVELDVAPAVVRVDVLLRTCALRGMDADALVGACRAAGPVVGLSPRQNWRTFSPLAAYAQVPVAPVLDGDSISADDLEAGIDMLSTSQLVLGRDELDQVLAYVADGDPRGATNGALRTHCTALCDAVAAEGRRIHATGRALVAEAPRDAAGANAAAPPRAVRSGTWGLLYCGGSRSIRAQVRAIGKDLEIPVAVEQFDW